MELGNEVSVKIKSAIRARLKELGIEWDRELPDYVMVLIANKKSKEQMEEDLTIFLGTHTQGFTAWLHNVLKKLEECGISRGLTKRKEDDDKSKSKRRQSDENNQEIKKLKGDNEKEDDNFNNSSGSDSEEVPSNQDSLVAKIDEGIDLDVSYFSEPTVAKSGLGMDISTNQEEVKERLESDLNENDMKAESMEVENGLENKVKLQVGERSKPKEKIEISWNNKNENNTRENSSQERRSSQPPERNSSGSRNQRRRSRSRSISQNGFKEEKHVSVLRRGLKEKKQERKTYRESRNIYRRRNSEEKRNGYSIKSRLKGQSHREKDRHFKSRSRSMDVDEAKLPSLVQVKPRPVRPPGIQPSSNLILKAVAEAQKSIATSSLPQPDEKLLQKEEKEKMSRKKIYRKKHVPSFQRENISVTLLNDRVISDKIREEQVDSGIFENIRKQENNLNDGPEVERFTISLASDDNDSLVASDFEEAEDCKRSDEENDIESDQNGIQNEEPMEISAVGTTLDSVEESELRDITGQKFDRRRLGPRVVPDPNTVLSCLAPAEDSITKTIVNENAYASNETKLDENGKVIKCKFWPTCEAGNDCRFYHPKEYCRTLPNCKFGQKCLYYHPPCKFADKCLNVTCPYTHTPVTVTPTVKAKVWTKVPLAPSNGQICMYYPNCRKPFCPYQHSYGTTGIPCKFGLNCTKIGCEFDHTQQSKNPYKWVAPNPE